VRLPLLDPTIEPILLLLAPTVFVRLRVRLRKLIEFLLLMRRSLDYGAKEARRTKDELFHRMVSKGLP
jgi:hypothetical protein